MKNVEKNMNFLAHVNLLLKIKFGYVYERNFLLVLVSAEQRINCKNPLEF
jgi:hypothetical protein